MVELVVQQPAVQDRPDPQLVALERRQDLVAGRDVVSGAQVAVGLVPEGHGGGQAERRELGRCLLGDGVPPAGHRAGDVAADLVGDHGQHAVGVRALHDLQLARGTGGQVGEDPASA